MSSALHCPIGQLSTTLAHSPLPHSNQTARTPLPYHSPPLLPPLALVPWPTRPIHDVTVLMGRYYEGHISRSPVGLHPPSNCTSSPQWETDPRLPNPPVSGSNYGNAITLSNTGVYLFRGFASSASVLLRPGPPPGCLAILWLSRHRLNPAKFTCSSQEICKTSAIFSATLHK